MRPLPRFPVWLWIVVSLLGLGLAGLGLLLAFLPFAFPESLEMISVIVAGYGLLGMTLGIGLCVAGVQGWRQRPPRRFYLRWGWLIFLLSSLVLGVVAVIIPAFQNQPLFALFHFALIGLPGLFLFSLVTLAAGSDVAMTVRQWIVALTAGASTIILAMPRGDHRSGDWRDPRRAGDALHSRWGRRSGSAHGASAAVGGASAH